MKIPKWIIAPYVSSPSREKILSKLPYRGDKERGLKANEIAKQTNLLFDLVKEELKYLLEYQKARPYKNHRWRRTDKRLISFP